jgi:hemerythrin-like domain-containing protein
MATPTVHQRPDTREMVVVHDLFRREFGNLPGLVRGVAPGDTERAAVVVEFLRELAAGLHHHHTGEDELMWPLLLERAPMDSALILRMEEQHERIAELYRRAERFAGSFTARADVESRDSLAETLTDLNDALGEHLHDEEVHILPLAERVMTVPEWEALGERGRAGIPRNRMPVFLGFLLDANTAEQGRRMLTHVPRPARVAWSLSGRRAFRREYRRVYGGDPE